MKSFEEKLIQIFEQEFGESELETYPNGDIWCEIVSSKFSELDGPSISSMVLNVINKYDSNGWFSEDEWLQVEKLRFRYVIKNQYYRRNNLNKVQKGVQEFHEKYGCLTKYKPTIPDPQTLLLRAGLIVEEASEFMSAARNRDMEKMVDALADLLYVTYGTAVVMGVDMEPISDEVQRSNMTKDGGGKDSGGKIMKGPDFSPPNIQKCLIEQGYSNNA